MTHIAQNFFDTPWAILPEKLDEIHRFVEARVLGDIRLTESEIRAATNGRQTAGKSMQTVGQVAVIPVYGVIVQRANMVSNFSGGTSTELLARDFNAAIEDGSVRAIVLDMDSPGGSVHGVTELASMIRAARGKKRIVSIANCLMASAAYEIGAAAGEVVTSSSAQVGSIGVAAIHRETSKADEAAGIKTTLIKAGRYKTVGNPYEPLSADSIETMQSKVDYYCQLFVDSVAQSRGVDAVSVRDRMGDGRVFVGQQAVDAGLADRISTLDQLLAELNREAVGSSSGPLASKTIQRIPQTPRQMWESAADLRAEFPDFETYASYRQAEAAGKAKLYGGKPSTGPADELPLPPPSRNTAATNYHSEWKASPSIRAEFADDFECFASYRKAVEAGVVKEFGGRH